MSSLQANICRNPDHDFVQSKYPNPTPPTWYRSRGAGRPRVYCDVRCKRWYEHNYDADGNRVPREHNARSWIKSKRRYATGVRQGASAEVAKVLAEDPDRIGLDPTALSLDMDIRKNGTAAPFTLADADAVQGLYDGPDTGNTPDYQRKYDPNMFQSTIVYPLDGFGFRGMDIRFTYYRALNAGQTGDGVNVNILRHSDGALMSTAHPQAEAIVGMLATDEWQDRYHAWLEGLRVAASAGQLDGESPVIAPSAAASAHLN